MAEVKSIVSVDTSTSFDAIYIKSGGDIKQISKDDFNALVGKTILDLITNQDAVTGFSNVFVNSSGLKQIAKADFITALNMGTVKTVNYLQPDSKGNVNITQSASVTANDSAICFRVYNYKIQVGTIPKNTTAVTFPEPFSDTNYFLIMGVDDVAFKGTTTAIAYQHVIASAKTTTGFTKATVSGTGATTYIAFGK